MNQSYLIPANSKRSMLILSLFAPIDLAIVGVGAALMVILLLVFGSGAKDIKDIIIIMLPLIITGGMVAPVPNHRNVWQLTVHVYGFLMSQRQYTWRGWCLLHGYNNKQ